MARRSRPAAQAEAQPEPTTTNTAYPYQITVSANDKTSVACPKCNKPLTCAHCAGSSGGKKSRRKITPEQQAKMQQARKRKITIDSKRNTTQRR